jgi:DNA invertase Pin-like site-specific DNA recombinase
VAVAAIIALLLSVVLLAVIQFRTKPDPSLVAIEPPAPVPPPPIEAPTPLPTPEQADTQPALEQGRATAAPAPEGGERDAGRSAREELPLLGYASVEASAEEFDAQAEAIDSECQKRDLHLLELVREREPLNGKGLARPGLAYALRRVSAGEAQGLVVSDLERLTRSAAELGQVLESVLRAQGRLIVAHAGIDTRDQSGRLAARALIDVSGWERKRLSDRTRKGLEAARRRRHEGVELRERIAGMRDEGMTLQAIADRLNEEGEPTLRGGKLWRPSSVQSAAGYRRPARDPLSTREGKGD